MGAIYALEPQTAHLWVRHAAKKGQKGSRFVLVARGSMKLLS